MRAPLVHFRHRALILVGMTVWFTLFLLYGPLATLRAFKQTASAHQSPSGAIPSENQLRSRWCAKHCRRPDRC
jgi:hypothetical protein